MHKQLHNNQSLSIANCCHCCHCCHCRHFDANLRISETAEFYAVSREAFRATSPWNPSGRTFAQAPRGCCTEIVDTAHTHNIFTEFQTMSLRLSNSVTMAVLANLCEFAPPLLAQCSSAVKPSKGTLHRRPIENSLAISRCRNDPGPQKHLKYRVFMLRIFE